MSFYLKRFVKSIIKSKIDLEKDNRKTILSKIKKECGDKVLNEIRPLITKYWSIEKPIVANILDMIEERGNGDFHENMEYKHIGNPVMFRSPDKRYLKVSDYMFTPCKRCLQRLYPEFNFCPHCGYENNDNTTVIDPTSFDIDQYQDSVQPQIVQPQDVTKPQQTQQVLVPVQVPVQCSSINEVIVEDAIVGRITKKDIDKEISNVKKFIP